MRSSDLMRGSAGIVCSGSISPGSIINRGVIPLWYLRRCYNTCPLLSNCPHIRTTHTPIELVFMLKDYIRILIRMPTHSEFLDRCSFVGTRGPCGRKCFRGVCGNHRGKTPMVLCKNCGKRGTSAPHGYCQALETGCRWKSQYGSRNLKEKRDDMDDYIDEILSWDWESYTYHTRTRRR